MRLIPKYQKAGSLNKDWIRDRDINGNWGYKNFKTGQFRTTLPNSKEAQQQEQLKKNNAVLKTYSANKARYNTEIATRRNHSDEIINKVISRPEIVVDKSGNMNIVHQNELAPGEDSAQLNTTIEEQIPIFKGIKLAAGLGKLALSKMGQNSLSHWARNSLLNEVAGDLTTNIATPLISIDPVPLEDGFAYRTFTPTNGGWVKDGKLYNINYGLGDVKIIDGKYHSVRPPHFNNPDKLWWDTSGHNRGWVVQVTNEANTQTLQDASKNGFNFDWGAFSKGYRLSDPIETDKVITYKFDPITRTMVPSIPGKIVTNKQSPFEIFQTTKLIQNRTQVQPSLNFLDERFLIKANNFANTYGYPKISYIRGVDTSADLESSVKAMLERHNTFARGVHTPDIEEQEQIKSIIGQNASMDDMLKYVSTHGRPEDPRKRIFISGTSNAQAYSGFPNNGRTALVQRKYKLGSDRNKWFDEADFKIYSQPESDNITFPHIRAPWAQGKSKVPETELSSENGELIFKGWAQPELRTVKDTEGNRHWWLQEQFPENKLSKNLKVK